MAVEIRLSAEQRAQQAFKVFEERYTRVAPDIRRHRLAAITSDLNALMEQLKIEYMESQGRGSGSGGGSKVTIKQRAIKDHQQSSRTSTEQERLYMEDDLCVPDQIEGELRSALGGVSETDTADNILLQSLVHNWIHIQSNPDRRHGWQALASDWVSLREHTSPVDIHLLKGLWASHLGISELTKEVLTKILAQNGDIAGVAGLLTDLSMEHVYQQYCLIALQYIPTADVTLVSGEQVLFDITSQLEFCVTELDSVGLVGQSLLRAAEARMEIFLRRYSHILEERATKNKRSPEKILLTRRDEAEAAEETDDAAEARMVREDEEDRNYQGYTRVVSSLDEPLQQLDQLGPRRTGPDTSYYKSLLYGTPEYEQARNVRLRRKLHIAQAEGLIRKLNSEGGHTKVLSAKQAEIARVPEQQYQISTLDNDLLSFNAKIAVAADSLLTWCDANLVKYVMTEMQREKRDKQSGGKAELSTADLNELIIIRAKFEDAIVSLRKSRVGSPGTVDLAIEYFEAVIDAVREAEHAKNSFLKGNIDLFFQSVIRGTLSAYWARQYYSDPAGSCQVIPFADEVEMLEFDHKKTDMIVQEVVDGEVVRSYTQVKSTIGRSREVTPIPGSSLLRVTYTDPFISPRSVDMAIDVFLTTLDDSGQSVDGDFIEAAPDLTQSSGRLSDKQQKYFDLMKKLAEYAKQDTRNDAQVSWRLILINPYKP